MSIHSGHPFLEPAGDRSPVRWLRGRWPSGVAIIATGQGTTRVGLTVSSLLVVDGDPGVIVAMLDPLSDLAESLAPGTPAVVNVLSGHQSELAEVFAARAPAPGGMFTVGAWEQTVHGPALEGAAAAAAVRVSCVAEADTAWSRRHELTIEQIVLHEASALAHERGRYRSVD